MVFSFLGYMSYKHNVALDKVARDGTVLLYQCPCLQCGVCIYTVYGVDILKQTVSSSQDFPFKYGAVKAKKKKKKSLRTLTYFCSFSAHVSNICGRERGYIMIGCWFWVSHISTFGTIPCWVLFNDTANSSQWDSQCQKSKNSIMCILWLLWLLSVSDI